METGNVSYNFDEIRPLNNDEVKEAIEEAILNSLAMARTVTGYHGNTRYSFTDLYLEEWERKRKDADGKGEN